MDWLEANGVGLRYDLAGSGAKTLELVHEMGGSLDSWDMVLPALAADRRVLRYDTRGAGQSEKVRGALALDTMVDDLAALLDALGIDRPIALAGKPGRRTHRDQRGGTLGQRTRSWCRDRDHGATVDLGSGAALGRVAGCQDDRGTARRG